MSTYKYTLEQLETKLNELREKYKVSLPVDRKLLETRAKLIKRQIEIYQSKKGFL